MTEKPITDAAVYPMCLYFNEISCISVATIFAASSKKPYPGLEPGIFRLGGGCLNRLASRANA